MTSAPKVFCIHNRCINEAESENYVKDTPLCTVHREALERFVLANTTQPWRRLIDIFDPSDGCYLGSLDNTNGRYQREPSRAGA